MPYTFLGELEPYLKGEFVRTVLDYAIEETEVCSLADLPDEPDVGQGSDEEETSEETEESEEEEEEEEEAEEEKEAEKSTSVPS